MEFCNQGTSHILGAIQIADVLTGAVCAVANKAEVAKEKQHVINHITSKNNDVALDWASLRLPKLNDLKIHFFDPDTR